MIRFRKVEIRDFGVISKADVDLADQGLVLIRGDNRDTDAAVSNGAGKSTIFSALSWALYGETVAEGRIVNVVRKGAKRAKVVVTFEVDGNVYTATRTRTASSTTLDLQTNGEATSERGSRDTEAKIALILGLDWMAFRSTVLFGQGDLQRFADRHTTDTQRKAVLKEVLRLGRFDDALKRVREKRKALDVERGETKTAIAQNETAYREVSKSINDTRLGSKLWGQNHTLKIERLRAAVADIVKPGKKEQAAAATLARLEAVAPKIEEKIEELTSKVETARSAHQAAERVTLKARSQNEQLEREKKKADVAVRQAKDDLREAETSNVCPTCRQDITHSSHFSALLDEKLRKIRRLEGEARNCALVLEAASANLEAAEKAEEEASLDLETLKDGLATWKAKKAEVDKQLASAREARASIDLYEERVKAAEQRITDALTETDPHAASLAELNLRRREVEVEGDRLRATLASIEERDRPLVFWEEGFGNRGLPSLAMDAIMPILTERANRYLGTLADGDITVKIATERALKGGGSQDAITLTPTTEGHEDVPPSGAQRAKISLAVALSLAELVASREGAQVDLLLLDEVLDGLDVEGRARVVDLLRELRERRNTILVVSHDEGVTEAFEKVITVVKENGAAVLEVGES